MERRTQVATTPPAGVVNWQFGISQDAWTEKLVLPQGKLFTSMLKVRPSSDVYRADHVLGLVRSSLFTVGETVLSGSAGLFQCTVICWQSWEQVPWTTMVRSSADCRV